MKVRIGDIVTITDMGIGELELTSDPEDELMSFSKYKEIKVTGHLGYKNVGIVTMVKSHDARRVFIVGSRGSGWTMGAWIRRVG
jgi:hypothetical protein